MRYIVSSSPGRVKPKDYNIVFVTSSLSTHHYWVRAEIDWLGTSIKMCPNEATFLPDDCCSVSYISLECLSSRQWTSLYHLMLLLLAMIKLNNYSCRLKRVKQHSLTHLLFRQVKQQSITQSLKLAVLTFRSNLIFVLFVLNCSWSCMIWCPCDVK